MVMGRNESSSNAMETVQMTVEEYLEMKSRQETKEVTTKQKNLVYGLEGIKTLFGCSTTTAWRIKNSEWIRPAISQVGRKIVVDADLALELANENTQRVMILVICFVCHIIMLGNIVLVHEVLLPT